MPTFERVGDDDQVVERRHVPYRSRDLASLERSSRWRKVAETYAPATSSAPRPTVEEQRLARAEAAKTSRAKTAAKTADGGG